jgi:hypothetical protein
MKKNPSGMIKNGKALSYPMKGDNGGAYIAPLLLYIAEGKDKDADTLMDAFRVSPQKKKKATVKKKQK